ncbi:sensor histidine kinase, partial [Enterococcus faecium]
QLRRESYARVAASRQDGEADERARLAGEIHDTIAQGLSSIQMLLHSAERRVTEQQIDDPDLLRELRLARNTAADNVL